MSVNTSGFGAYDIRGKYPESINQELAYRVGRVFPEIFDAKKVVIGHDIRLSSPTISDSLARGLTEAGCDVCDLGQCGTEMIYFATGFNELDGGIMITASHNPQEYNGLKFVRKGAQPISADTGLLDIKAKIEDESRDWSHKKATGTIYKIDVMPEYIKRLLTYVDVKSLKPFKIVINTGNGSAGPIINELEKFLPFDIVKINNDPDGYFPNGVPNPLLEDSREQTAKAVVENNAVCGIAFDGDFDRCFLFDEKGGFIEGSYLVGILAGLFLEKNPGATIICEPRSILNTIDIVERLGGKYVLSRSGHPFMKATLRKENGIYGGELASHHYFRDFFYCDSGMIPWLMILEMVSKTGKKLSEIMAEVHEKHPVSGEINTKVSSNDKVREIMDKIENIYGKQGKICRVDGLAIDFENWRFSLRGSQTEPYIRLNVESQGDRKLMESKRDELLAIIRE